MPFIFSAPGLKPPPVAMVTVGPVNLAPDVRWKSQYIDDNLNGEIYSFHFSTGVRWLNSNQKKILKDSLIPLLKATGACAEFYGLADRTGSQKVNYEVSMYRLWGFQMDALNSGAPADLVWGDQHKSFGEDYAEVLGDVDESSDFYERSVVAFVWPNFQSSQRIFVEMPFLQYARSTPQPF